MVEVYKGGAESSDSPEDAFEEAETVLESSGESKEEGLFWEEMKTQKMALDALRVEEDTIRLDIQADIDAETRDAYSEAETLPQEVSYEDAPTVKDLASREFETPVEMTEDEIMGEMMELDEVRKDYARDLFLDDDDSDLSPELVELKSGLLDAVKEMKNDPSLEHVELLQELSVNEVADAFMDDDNMDSEVIAREVRKVSRLMPSEMWRRVKAQIQYGETADSLGRFNKRLEKFKNESVEELKHGVADARYDLEAVVAAAGMAGIYKYERVADPLKKDWVKVKEATPEMMSDIKVVAGEVGAKVKKGGEVLKGDWRKMKEATPMMAGDVKDIGVAGAKTTAKVGAIGAVFAAIGGAAFFKSLFKSAGKEVDNFRAFAKSWIEPIPFVGSFFKSSRERSEERKKKK